MPATGIVLVSMVRMVSSGRFARYWLTTSTTIRASPPNINPAVRTSRNLCVSSSEEP